MIHPLLVDNVIDYIMGLSPKAVVTIDGIDREYEYYRVMREGNLIKKYVYLQDETGKITGAHAVDVQGRQLESYQAHIEKGPDGFMVVFLLELKIEGMVIS